MIRSLVVIAFVLLFSTSAESQDIETGILAHYKLDNNALDSGVNQYHGLLSNPEPLPIADRFGNLDSAYLYGGSEYILTTLFPQAPSSESRSFSFWIKADGSSIGKQVINLEKRLAQEFGFRIPTVSQGGGNGEISFILRDDSWTTTIVTSSTIVANDEWHHVVGVRDVQSDQLLLYIDGQLDNNVEDLSVTNTNVNDTRALAIGANNHSFYGLRDPFIGALDEVRYYDRALTALDVTALYQEGENNPPIVDVFTAPLEPVDISDQPITVSATFTDPDVGDSHSVIWNWGDDTFCNSESDPECSVDQVVDIATGSHTYDEPGVYTLTLTVNDLAGESGMGTYEFVVVYDPSGGFVTGGGWITSPVGAYTTDTNLTGPAHFGFVSKYKKGASIPTGQTQFQFQLANLNFHSASYDWLVVAGHKAKYKGSGSINGTGDYGFMLTATDEKLTPSTNVDLFRIKIWDKMAGDVVVYDNQLGDTDDADPMTAIEQGNIVIHKAKNGGGNLASASERESPEGYSLTPAYPNPFNPSTTIAFELPNAEHVRLSVYTSSGREVGRLVDGMRTSGQHQVVFEAGNLPSGLYLYRFAAGSFYASGKLTLTK